MDIRENLKAKFNLPQKGFLAPVDLIDTNIGFSFYKDREKIGYKSLFRIYITNKDYEKIGTLKPLIISVTYGKEIEEGGGITIASSEFKRKLNWPIDLISTDDYFYNIETDTLYKKDKVVDGLTILKQIDESHTKPTKLILGFKLRIKLFFHHKFLASIIKIIFNLFSFFQYLISGKKVEIYGDLKEFQTTINPSSKVYSVPSKNFSPIDIFGYKLDPWIAVLYCILHLIAYFIFYTFKFKPVLLVTIFKNNFLTLIYGIFSLSLIKLILSFLNFINFLKILQEFYFKSLSKKIKI